MKKDTTPKTRYERRGVSSTKEEVHKAVSIYDKGLFPGAFCKVVPDYINKTPKRPQGDPKYCNIMHADGGGTKVNVAYLEWKTTGRLDLWEYAVRDSLFMNTDDIACVNEDGTFLISQTIDRDKFVIKPEVLDAVATATKKVCMELTELGVECIMCGGETADVNDTTRTITINHTIATRCRRDRVIDASNISFNSCIVGFSSTGRAKWETVENSGGGANGFTLARHDLLSRTYLKFPETFAPEMDLDDVYCGPYKLSDPFPGLPGQTVAQALSSPTRTYIPLSKKIVKEVGHKWIEAFIHNSGGGQTKIGKFGPMGARYVKDNLFPMPPFFAELQRVCNLPLREMYPAYNCGHRFEAVVKDRVVAQELIAISQSLGIDAQVVGYVEMMRETNKREVVIENTGLSENEKTYVFD